MTPPVQVSRPRRRGREGPADRQRRRVDRLVAPLNDGLRWGALTYRSERNPSRSSEAYSSGCSQAAKCPPRSTSLKWTRLAYAFSAQLRGARKSSSGKTLTATGTVTFRALAKLPYPRYSQYDFAVETPVLVSQNMVTLSRMSSRVRPPSTPSTKAGAISVA